MKTVELDLNAGQLLYSLRDFAIFTPDTNTLRGLVPDRQQRAPVGLSGGQISNAFSEVLKSRKEIKKSGNETWIVKDSFVKKVITDAKSMIDWADRVGTASASSMPLSSSVGTTQRVIRFKDRFMNPKRNILTGYDASEGALYILFHAVLASHFRCPSIFAVDNADHALNPRLARELFKNICQWYLDFPYYRQLFLTTQNPLTLDGLPLQDDLVRLFTVDRTESGRTVIRRIILNEKLRDMAKKGWTLSRLWTMGHLGGVPDV